MLTERIETLLVGNATGLVNTFREGGTAAEGFAAKTTTTGRAMQALGIQGMSTGDMIGKGLKVGAAVGGIALAKFAFDGVKAFAETTAGVRGFQRVLGGTAEDSSRLAAATARMGIDAQGAQTAFGQLAKRIGEGKDTLGQWGVAIARSKDGTVDMSATLANVSEKYRSIKDPAERAAFASENFGKGFQTINALLGQGKDNLQKFYDIAAQKHQVFSQEELDKGLKYSRAMKDLEATFQGLQLQIGSALMPVLTGFAKVLEVTVGALDAVGNAMGGVQLSGIAMGAVIGNMIVPGWGALAGATVGLIGSLAAVDKQFGALGQGVAGLATKIDTLSQKQALLEWNKATKQLGDLGGAFDSAGARLKLFTDLADKSPAAAQKIIDGMKASGQTTGQYEAALAKVVVAHGEHKRNADASKAANDAFATSTNQSTGALKEQNAALQQQVKDLTAAHNALLQSQGGEIARQQAVISATKAQDDFNKAVADYGPFSTQARDASLALQQARLTEASSTLSAKQSQDDLTSAVKNTPAAIDAQIAKIREAIAKYGDADGALQSQIDTLNRYRYELLLVPAAVATKVTADTIEAEAAFRALHAQLINLTAQEWRIAVKVGGDPIPGIVGSDRNHKLDIRPLVWN